VHVSRFVPDYEQLIKSRYEELFLPGKNGLIMKLREWYINIKFQIKKMIIYK